MPRTVVVPSSLPSPITSDLRSALTSALLATSAVQSIHKTLLSSCQSAGWPDKARARALELIRSGECVTFGEVMDVLVAEARGKACSDRPRITNGLGNDKGKMQDLDIRVPEDSVAEGVKIVKRALDKAVKIEGSEGKLS